MDRKTVITQIAVTTATVVALNVAAFGATKVAGKVQEMRLMKAARANRDQTAN
jgi:hypothetical protein